MIKEQYEDLKMKRELRKNLIALKQELKEEQIRQEMLALLDGDYSVFTQLLEDSEPKVRKNAE